MHPEDWPILQRFTKHIDADPKDFRQFLKSDRFGSRDHKLHLSLLPLPYSGNLETAEIFILLLNPGFSYVDYYEEYECDAFRERRIKNLAQDFEGVEFPFSGLDPEFCWGGGFAWWESKLYDVIGRIAQKRFSGRYLHALQYLSQRMAHVELIPYHSSGFSSHALIQKLPSAQMARAFVRDVLIPDARRGDRIVIVTRRAKDWGFPKGRRGVVIYKGGHTRGASLSPNSSGGRAILRRLGC